MDIIELFTQLNTMFQVLQYGENRESGENPERARHCKKVVLVVTTRLSGEGDKDGYFESGDLPETE